MDVRPETKLLQDRIICIPGGRDKDGRPIILITIPQDSPTLEITSCLQHVLTIYSEDTKRQGLTIILDARKGPWKIARSCIRQITATMNADELAHFIVLRPENFLDKQRVENCTNTPKDGHVST
ncbi:sec14 domain and spectrin repeat-containing protein 1 [Holotrichia oblita]|uniref:Sec14 domain and spectrin repeat-containing protein 1 n=2 Tax=Holotrichia oblita TaxID=644536 RepID=A0ACB9TWV9_HOLOL|nr:sec14 domain and spectrin repeat-containing protein 1 [Holotrichia oblita]KAI4471241.1 sec14 domain and spectrin repeat-containing protein 1 [Holotrichia oblita]